MRSERPIIKSAELDRNTLIRLFDYIDALMEYMENEDTSASTYIDGLQEVAIDLMHLLEGRDV